MINFPLWHFEFQCIFRWILCKWPNPGILSCRQQKVSYLKIKTIVKINCFEILCAIEWVSLLFSRIPLISLLKVREEGITRYSKNLSILNILSYSYWNLFWDAKILGTREIMTIFKLLIRQFWRLFWSWSADPPISFHLWILRIGGPGSKQVFVLNLMVTLYSWNQSL